MKDKKVLWTIACSAIAMGANYLIQFFLTPFITETVGAEAYGFVSLAKQFTNYAGIITIALNAYATRYIAVTFHQGNLDRCNTYFSSVLIADCIIGAVICTLFAAVTYKLEFILRISQEIVSQVKLLFLLSGVTFGITTAFTVFSSSAYIKNQLDKANLLKCVCYVVEAVALIVLFCYFPTKVWYIGIGTVLSAILISVSNYYLYRKYTPEICFSGKMLSLSAIRELVGNGIWNSLNSLGNVLNSGLDLIITNLMLSELAMGQLAIAKTISSMFFALFQMVSQPFHPVFLKDYSKGDKDVLLKDLNKAVIVCGLFSNLAFAGFFALGMLYYRLWIPHQDIQTVWLLTVITIFSSVVEGAGYPLYYIYTLTVKNKIPCLITIAGGILNVISMYLLLKYTNLGAYAVVLTTAVIMTFINVVTNPLYMARCLKLEPFKLYPMLIKHIFSCFVMTWLCCLVGKTPMRTTWISFLLKAMICCLVCTPVHFLITARGIRFRKKEDHI